MIKLVQDPRELNSALLRSREILSDDEQLVWLDRTDVFCLAEDNEMHATHLDVSSLRSSFALFGKEPWYAVSLGHPGDVWKVEDPVPVLQENSFDQDLSSEFAGQNFLLFQLEADAAIYYSNDFEYRLVSGSREFVETYFSTASLNPVEELKGAFESRASGWESIGSTDMAAYVRQWLTTALSRVKLPPGTSA